MSFILFRLCKNHGSFPVCHKSLNSSVSSCPVIWTRGFRYCCFVYWQSKLQTIWASLLWKCLLPFPHNYTYLGTCVHIWAQWVRFNWKNLGFFLPLHERDILLIVITECLITRTLSVSYEWICILERVKLWVHVMRASSLWVWQLHDWNFNACFLK